MRKERSCGISTFRRTRLLPHNRPDIVVIDKAKKECHIIDVACPGDSRIVFKEEEKIDKYRDLAIEIKALWCLKKVLIVPVIIGALGSITDRLEGYLADIHVGLKPVSMQKTVCLVPQEFYEGSWKARAACCCLPRTYQCNNKITVILNKQ